MALLEVRGLLNDVVHREELGSVSGVLADRHGAWWSEAVAGVTFENKPDDAGRPDDRYLSPRTLHEAADVLFGLAAVLGRVEGVWADDAEQDARHLRLVAEALAGWLPRPRESSVEGRAPDPAWDMTLALYFRQGFPPGS